VATDAADVGDGTRDDAQDDDGHEPDDDRRG
jgi:hypothetical protein